MTIDPKIMDHPDIGKLLKIAWINGFSNYGNTKLTDVRSHNKPTMEEHLGKVLKLNGLRNPYDTENG